MAFNKSRHIKYWRMCSNMLPDAYISGDASRMFLGYFIVAAFDVLGEPVGEADRQAWISWIYGCQCAEGGFRGFTGTDLRHKRSDENRHWDPANLPNTFFALASLLILGDDMSRVKRKECLAWLPRLQRSDGSFGEVLSTQNTIEGGRDLRYCCCAAGIVYILNDPEEPVGNTCFDEDKLVDYIESCRNYNGGYGESPMREPHSGLNYCAIATLGLLQRLRGSSSTRAREILENSRECIRWLVERHTDTLYEDDENEDQEDSGEETKLENKTFEAFSSVASEDVSASKVVTEIVGFNGRDNKVADTCYCFWNAGALAVLKSLDLVSKEAVKQYLLKKTQHTIGGFGKSPDALPDILHSYLGLAALSLFEEPNIKSIDPMLCISEGAASNLESVCWRSQSR